MLVHAWLRLGHSARSQRLGKTGSRSHHVGSRRREVGSGMCGADDVEDSDDEPISLENGGFRVEPLTCSAPERVQTWHRQSMSTTVALQWVVEIKQRTIDMFKAQEENMSCTELLQLVFFAATARDSVGRPSSLLYDK